MASHAWLAMLSYSILIPHGRASEHAVVVDSTGVAHSVDQSSFIQTRVGIDSNIASAREDVPSIYQPVKRPPVNKFARFIFFAGLGGTGHHGWHETMKKSSACITHPGAEGHMRKLWFGEDDNVDVFYQQLVAELRNTTEYHIQTDCNSKRHHPDLVSLASAAADAGADLRIIAMHRDPAPMLVSLSLHRGLLPLAEEANQMANQAAILHAQLASIDPQLFVCVPFTGVVERAGQISDFVVGDMGQSFAGAIHTHYIDHHDDVAAARDRIMKHEKHIISKMKTWEAFHGLLLHRCSQRTPQVQA